MPRKPTGETRTGIVRQKRRNGDIYVMERTYRYDPDRMYNRVIGCRLLGKIKAGTTEMVPTRPRRTRAEMAGAAKGEEQPRTGSSELLRWIGKKSCIDEDLSGSLGDGRARMVATIARFWLANPNSRLIRIRSWQVTHRTPCATEITARTCRDFLEDLGCDEDARYDFYRRRAARCDCREILAFDFPAASNFFNSSGSEGTEEIGGLSRVKLLLAYSLKSRQPVAITRQPDSLEGVKSLEAGMKRLKWIGMERVRYVTDIGFRSDAVIDGFLSERVKFLTLASLEQEWIAEAFGPARAQLDLPGNTCSWDRFTCGVTVRADREIMRERKRAGGGFERGFPLKERHRLWLHFFLNTRRAAEDEAEFRTRLKDIAAQVQADGGTGMLSPAAQKLAAEFLTVTGSGETLRAVTNNAALSGRRRRFGCFVLVSNRAEDTFDALRYYRFRKRVEVNFQSVSGIAEGGFSPRMWYDYNHAARIFCQFAVLGYWCCWRNTVDDIWESLKKRDPDETQEERTLKENMMLRLESRSLNGILDWFDAIEITRRAGESGAVNLRTRMTDRDRMLLEMLTGDDADMISGFFDDRF